MSFYTDLKNSEISINKNDHRNIHAVFYFKQQMDLFNGHFPGNPILPGIFQIEMVKYALERSLDTLLFIASIKKTKFSSLIHPEKTVTIDIKVNKEENHLFNVKAVIRVADTIAGKINLILGKENKGL